MSVEEERIDKAARTTSGRVTSNKMDKSIVVIKETRPRSKTKSWELVSIDEKATQIN